MTDPRRHSVSPITHLCFKEWCLKVEKKFQDGYLAALKKSSEQLTKPTTKLVEAVKTNV